MMNLEILSGEWTVSTMVGTTKERTKEPKGQHPGRRPVSEGKETPTWDHVGVRRTRVDWREK